MLTESDIQKIKNCLVVAEQGTQRIKYGSVYVMADGPNGVKQLTLSIGFTQFGGNLSRVLEEYEKRGGGRHSKTFASMLNKMKQLDTAYNQVYINALKEAGSEGVMQEAQEDCFDRLYVRRGIVWGDMEGFVLPLSFLIICDSFLHSGSILGSLRSKFKEKTPSNGGNEKVWITEYLRARHNWLATHSSSLLRKTVYRTNYYTHLIGMEDWYLLDYYRFAMNGVKPLEVA